MYLRFLYNVVMYIQHMKSSYLYTTTPNKYLHLQQHILFPHSRQRHLRKYPSHARVHINSPYMYVYTQHIPSSFASPKSYSGRCTLSTCTWITSVFLLLLLQRTGSVRGEDIPYVLGLPLVNGGSYFPHNYSHTDEIVSKTLIHYISNFARSGWVEETESGSNRIYPEVWFTALSTVA